MNYERLLPDCARCGQQPHKSRVRGNLLRFMLSGGKRHCPATPVCTTGACDTLIEAQISWEQMQAAQTRKSAELPREPRRFQSLK